MKLTFLGTNGWYDTGTGNTVCTLLETKGFYIVFDAGFGFYKLDQYITEDKPIYLFISHLHIDHVCGLHCLPKFKFKQKLTILGSKKTKKYLKKFLNHPFTASSKELACNTDFIKLRPGHYKNPFKFSCLKLDHADYTLGYRIELDGKVITYCCDTGPCENDYKLAEGADALIHECALLPGEKDSWGHTSPDDVAKIAKKSNVKELYLTHFAAHSYLDLKKRKEAEKVAKKIFPNTIATEDGLVVNLDKKTDKNKFDFNPLDKIKITQEFGGWPEHYAKYNMKGHNGIDFRTKFDDSLDGKREVYAVLDGKVIERRDEDARGYGKYVKLEHVDGAQTVYAHFDKVSVKLNQKLKAGEYVGISDNSGDSTGPHLHFGYRPPNFDYDNGFKGYVDPKKMLI